MAQITPTSPQYKYIVTESQYPALVAGFGSGKTEAAVKRAIIGKLRYPNLNRGFYEPTYDLIRMIAFPRFEQALEELEIPFRLYKSPLNRLDIEGAGSIFFRSMDAPHRIVGYEHADADVDELDTLKTEDAAYVWRQILARNRQKKSDGKPNTIGVTTTPEGFRFVYGTWKKEPKPGYEIIQAPTASNPHLPSGYIESLKDAYPAHLLSAYLDGQFVNLTSGAVYPDFCRKLNNTDMTVQKFDEKFGKKAALHIGMDFNIGNMSATVDIIDGNKTYQMDEFMGIRDTPSMIAAIKSRYKDRTIMVYPDPSGNNRDTRSAGETDIHLLESAGFICIYDPAHAPVRDRVNSMNSMICNSLGERRMFVNVVLCPVSTDAVEQQVWDKSGKPDKDHDKDHPNDAKGYMIWQRFPISGGYSSVSRIG